MQAETTFWHGLFAPAGVSNEIAAKLNRAVHDIVAQPETKAWYLKLGAELGAGTPEQLGDEVRTGNGEVDRDRQADRDSERLRIASVTALNLSPSP